MHDVTALLASGYGPGALLRTILIPCAFVMFVTGLLNFYLTPHYTHELTRTLAQAEQDLDNGPDGVRQANSQNDPASTQSKNAFPE